MLEHPEKPSSSLVNKDVLIQGNRIAGIADHLEARDVPEGCRVMQLRDCLAVPGFVNAHTHNPMSLFRGFSDDLPLMDWLNMIWPAEAKMTDEMVYWGMKLSCLEMIKTGTTCFYDMYENLVSCARGVDEMGLRCVLAETIFAPEQGAGIPELERIWQDHQQRIKDLQGVKDQRIGFALGPHAIYTVREEALRWIGEQARLHQVPIHIHLAETAGEVEECVSLHGCSPVAYVERCGLLDYPVVAAHGVHLSDEDIQILARHRVSVVHNPNSNLKLASGYRFRYEEMKAAGINVALGTDGSCSSNNLDMLEAMKQAALVQKAWRGNPSVVPAHEALAWASLNGAKALNLPAGKLDAGYLADIALIDMEHYLMVPSHNAVSNLVYSANGSVVKHLICDGKILMENRVVPGEKEILTEAARCATYLYS